MVRWSSHLRGTCSLNSAPLSGGPARWHRWGRVAQALRRRWRERPSTAQGRSSPTRRLAQLPPAGRPPGAALHSGSPGGTCNGTPARPSFLALLSCQPGCTSEPQLAPWMHAGGFWLLPPGSHTVAQSRCLLLGCEAVAPLGVRRRSATSLNAFLLEAAELMDEAEEDGLSAGTLRLRCRR